MMQMLRRTVLLALAMLALGVGAHAQNDYTSTPNLGLKKPKIGSTNGGIYINQDFDTLDAAIGIFHGGFVAVSFSTTPTFNMILGNTFAITLSGNVSSSSVNQPNVTSGQILYLIVCQDATGGRTFAFPANFQSPNPVTISPNASTCSASTWLWDGLISRWINVNGTGIGPGAGAPLPFSTVAFSATPSFSGTLNAAYGITLTGNVTSSTVSGSPVNGVVMKLHICQGAGSPWTFAFPANFLNTTAIQATGCTDETYSFDGTNWSQLTQPAGGGGGGGSCSSSGAQGTIQAAGTAGACQSTNLSEIGGVLTINEDAIPRGPNPNGVDVRKFGARAINPSAIPSPTTTITSGTSAAVVSANTGLQIGDGFSIAGAGAAQTMTTPTAPIVTPSCAAGPTGLGFTVPAGAGSTAYQYQLAMRDVGQGITAAGTAGTTATGNATLGANSTAWTSSASGTTNVFTATVGSTANLAAGCMVVLKGSTDDAGFGGWKIVTSVVDGTHFTYTSGVDASRGISTTTVTGGTVSYWLCNHVVLPTPGAGGTQYAIYGRTAGSMGFLQMSLLANLGYTDPTYNTFDDYGSPMMDSGPRPWFVPTTPPGSPTNDTLVTTITNIVGTALTLDPTKPAGTSVTSAPSRFDNAPNIVAALVATNSTSITGAGGTMRFPAVVENSGTGNYCFVTSSYIVASVNAVIQDGAVCLGDTLQLTGNWYGTDNSAARQVLPQFAIRAHIPILIQGANPGIWIKTVGGLNKVSVSMGGNGGVGVFNAQVTSAQVLEDDNLSTGITNDYMSIAFYDYQSSAAGGFGGKMRNTAWAGGPDNVTVGRTATPIFATKFSYAWDFDYVSCAARGYSFVPFSAGLFGNFHMGEECQGNIMPIVMITPATVGNTSGAFKISQAVSDTGPAPTIANLGPLNAFTNADITIEGGNLPSANQPLISGSPFLGSVFLSGLSPGAQIGQNINLTVIGRNGNFASQLRTPSIRLAAINYTSNHTLAANEGIVNAQATLTFTIDTTLGDGQGYDVYSETGTTTLHVSAGTLHGNGATGDIIIPNNQGMRVFLKGGNAYAYGIGGGGAASPGGTTNALQYNGGGIPASLAGFNAPTSPGNYVCGYLTPTSAAVSPTCPLPGVPVNPQVGPTYTIGAANYWNDRGTVITATNAGAQTYTMVNPANTGFGFNMPYSLWNRGTSAGALTENASGFTVNGGASLLIPTGYLAHHWSDGVNWLAAVIPTLQAFVDCNGAGNAAQFTAATGKWSCGSSSSGVSSFSGDGALLNNSLSTGPVTATLANAAAHKFWMNNTGSAAAPGYQSPGKLDLLGTLVYTDQANTYGAFLQDFSAGTWKIPTAAGFTAGATSMFGYDSTNKNPKCYDNNADAICLGIPSAPTTGDLLDSLVVSGNVLAHDSGILTANVVTQISNAASGQVCTYTGANKVCVPATALPGGVTATTQSAKDNSTKVATTAYVDAPTGLTTGTSATLTAPRQYFVCTGTCTITVPVPAAGYEFCVMNDDNVATVITLSAIGSSARYENTARTAYGTAGTGTFVSSGAAADKVCLLGRDATHYLTASFNGTWTAN